MLKNALSKNTLKIIISILLSPLLQKKGKGRQVSGKIWTEHISDGG